MKSAKNPGIKHQPGRKSSDTADPRDLFFEDSGFLLAWKVLTYLRPATLPRADKFFKTFGD